jgi:hypothetical protein
MILIFLDCLLLASCIKKFISYPYTILNVKLLSYCRLRYFGKCNFLRNIDLLITVV